MPVMESLCKWSTDNQELMQSISKKSQAG